MYWLYPKNSCCFFELVLGRNHWWPTSSLNAAATPSPTILPTPSPAVIPFTPYDVLMFFLAMLSALSLPKPMWGTPHALFCMWQLTNECSYCWGPLISPICSVTNRSRLIFAIWAYIWQQVKARASNFLLPNSEIFDLQFLKLFE